MLVSKFSEGGECFEVQGSPESLTEVMEQLAAVFPSIVRPMITERDEYMAVRLRMLAPKCGPLQRLQGLHEGCWGGGCPPGCTYCICGKQVCHWLSQSQCC